ncbi:sugar-transfer associated ATP-grasp domain-containing protein [Aurantibacter sp.]|uniref:sugar-transfer associated ATP-grasp domain-containing protein n=1 Tax=Aurantibacter sp. TaxID=2807103 RepID=UPI003266E5BF
MRRLFRKIKNWFDSTKYKFVILANYLKHGAFIKKELRLNPQPKLSKEHKREIKDYFKSYGFGGIRLFWHQFYGGYKNNYSKNYIPQDLFFSHIEVALNRYDYSKLQDKNILDKIFEGVSQPNTIIKNINGFYQKNNIIISRQQAVEIIAQYDSIIIKPTIDTSGGKNVQKLDFSSSELINIRKNKIEKVLNIYNKEFVIQEIVNQSEEMRSLNPTSLNTIRICTYLNNSGVNVLFSIVRFGGKGVSIDNVSQGGYYCVIDENGSLDERAYDTWKKTIKITPGGAVLKNFEIPNYIKVIETVNKLHQQVPYFRMISWDIALDASNTPILIESNIFSQSIDFQSVTGPLFKEFTDEVLLITQNFKQQLNYTN